MNKITLTTLTHNNAPQIAIHFEFNNTIRNYIKKLEGVKWSQTHKTFYVSHTPLNKRALYLHLKKQNWNIDYKSLQPVERFVKTKKTQITKKNLSSLTKSHHKALTNYKDYLLQKRYSDNTIENYIGVIKVFFRYHAHITIDTITKEHVIDFNNNYILKNNYGITFQNQTISALKLFYKNRSNIDLNPEGIERPKKNRKLPEVLSIDEVKELLHSIVNVKHRSILSLVYACGLRIGEALDLKLHVIDGQRGFIHIKHGKGAKDRYVPLSDKTLAMLRHYYKLYKPKKYLFEGINGGKYSQESCRKIVSKALVKTGIKKRVTLHTLRHSYATHLLENGTDIRFIQDILGHNSPKTTMIYTHVSSTSLKKIKNPFDDMEI